MSRSALSLNSPLLPGVKYESIKCKEYIEVGPKKVWNSLEINEMIRDPESGYSYEEGLLFGGKPRVNASDGT